MPKPTKEGQRVRYSTAWLQSTGTVTGAIPFARGEVVKLEPFGRDGKQLATVNWNDPDVPKKVLADNLEVA